MSYGKDNKELVNRDFLGWDYQDIRSMLGDTLCVLIQHLQKKYEHPLDRLVVIKDILQRLKGLSVDGGAPHKETLKAFFNDLLPYLGMAAESEYNMAVRASRSSKQRFEEVDVQDMSGAEDGEIWFDIDVSDDCDTENIAASDQEDIPLTSAEKLSIVEEYGTIKQQLAVLEENLHQILGDPEEAKAEAEAAYAETFQGIEDAWASVQATLAATGYNRR